MGLIKGRIKIRLAYFFERLCYRCSDAVVCLSEGMRDDIVARFPNLNVHVIPNSADLDLFGIEQGRLALPSQAQGKKIFIYAGSLGLMDACEEIIYAAESLRNRNDLFFVIIGDGACRSQLEEMVQLKGLSDHFLFLGLQSKFEVAKWMQVEIGRAHV